jgi:hypothetical protein
MTLTHVGMILILWVVGLYTIDWIFRMLKGDDK